MKNPLFLLLFALFAVLGLWTYTQATGGTLSVCVKSDGDAYFIGEGFKRETCKKNEKLITWNAEGPQGLQGPEGPTGAQGEKGEKGDKGDAGDPAPKGAGNVAFTCSAANDPNYRSVLTTEGTVWNLERIRGQEYRWTKYIAPPIPLSQIVDWCTFLVLDVDGNMWAQNDGVWTNVGHP